jgi:osmotically-inducible protein OsmY
MLRLAAVGLALFAALVAGTVAPAAAQRTSGRGAAKPEETPPARLAREVRHQLLVLPYYSVFDFLSVAIDGDKVTLAGWVVRPTLKADAEAAMKSIEGVRTVVNQVEVLPPSPSDDDLRRAVYRAIYEDAGLARYAVQPLPSIHILVKGGNVSLAGSVSSAADKNLAGLRAAGVANVLAVKNNLVVESKGNTSQ